MVITNGEELNCLLIELEKDLFGFREGMNTIVVNLIDFLKAEHNPTSEETEQVAQLLSIGSCFFWYCYSTFYTGIDYTSVGSTRSCFLLKYQTLIKEHPTSEWIRTLKSLNYTGGLSKVSMAFLELIYNTKRMGLKEYESLNLNNKLTNFMSDYIIPCKKMFVSITDELFRDLINKYKIKTRTMNISEVTKESLICFDWNESSNFKFNASRLFSTDKVFTTILTTQIQLFAMSSLHIQERKKKVTHNIFESQKLKYLINYLFTFNQEIAPVVVTTHKAATSSEVRLLVGDIYTSILVFINVNFPKISSRISRRRRLHQH